MTRSGLISLAMTALLVGATPAHADRAAARARVEESVGLLAAGDRPGALTRLEAALTADPDYLSAYDAAIPLWIADGNWDVLVERLSRITLRHPDYLPGWYALGFAYRKRGRGDLAIACYELYVADRPDDPDPQFGIAMAALERGDKPRAAVALRRYLELERRPERAEYVARARAELADLEGAPPPASSPAPEPRVAVGWHLVEADPVALGLARDVAEVPAVRPLLLALGALGHTFVDLLRAAPAAR